jgi:hypothetical protein
VNEPQFDLALNAELQIGLVLLSHCRSASGIGVQPFRTATVCEFEPVLERTGSRKLAQTMDIETNNREDFAI